MINQFVHALRALKSTIGKQAVEQIATKLAEAVNSADGKFARFLLEGFSKAVRKNGVTGLCAALDGFQKMIEGTDVSDLNQVVGLRAKSEVLAQLQNAEAEKRVRLEGFVQTAFNIIKTAVVAAI